jgi:hypothetical protein
MKKTYEFIVTNLDHTINILHKECSRPLNTSIYTILLMSWHKGEILKFQIKEKNTNNYLRN